MQTNSYILSQYSGKTSNYKENEAGNTLKVAVRVNFKSKNAGKPRQRDKWSDFNIPGI